MAIKVFFSYSENDKNLFRANEIVNNLEKYSEIEKIYFWDRDKSPGEDLDLFMKNNIKRSDIMIFLCSENSLKANGQIAEREYANEFKKIIIPIFKNPEDISKFFRKKLIGIEFSDKYFEAFIQKIYNALLRNQPKIYNRVKNEPNEKKKNYIKHQLQRKRTDKISKEMIITELEKVAKKYNYIEYGKRDFNKISKISSTTVIREFGSWNKSIQFLKEYLKKKGIDLHSRKLPPNQIHSEKDLFNEMMRIWEQVGHRPSKNEWNANNPRISYSTYVRRFGGWKIACKKFIDSKIGNDTYHS